MANPIVSRAELAIGDQPMSVKGVIQKTSFLLALTTTSAIGFFFYIITIRMSMGMLQGITMGSMLIAFGLALLITFKPHMAKTVAAPYAILEGVFLAGASVMFARFDPSIPTNALAATFVTAAVMLGLYRSGIIKVTAKFRSILTSAILAIMLLYLVQIGMSFFGSSLPFLFNGGLVSIGFSLFVVTIASFSLLLDFDNIERGAAMGVSKDFEWLYGISVLASLVWMYIEFMRLLSYLQD